MQIKLISLTTIEHQDSLRNRDKQQLGNELLGPFLRRMPIKADLFSQNTSPKRPIKTLIEQ